MKDTCNESYIAIFGGTFNPVHNGHIAIAKYLIEKKLVDEVCVMPSYSSPHKEKDKICTYDKRVEMLNIAFLNEKNISVSTFEKEYCIRNNIEKSYSSLMLKGYSEAEKNKKIVFVTGFDSAKTLLKWYKCEYLIKNCDFIIFDRADDTLDSIEKKREILDNIKDDMNHKLRYTYIEEKIPNVSSTKLKILLKDAINNKDEIIKYIPLKVYDYIVENNLYKYEND